jgi:hypothetical protein
MATPLFGLPMAVGLVMAVSAAGPGVSSRQSARESEPAVATISTDHLKLRYVPALAGAPGDRLSLVVEIEPRARMHVYAPGADDYQIIALALDDRPFIRRLPLTYPPSEIYFFEPLNERVPVYLKPFKLTQEIVLEDKPETLAALNGGQKPTVTGTLEYQACDDRICFRPASVPLAWTITLRPATGRSEAAPAALP